MNYIKDKTYDLYFESLFINHIGGTQSYNLTPFKERAKIFNNIKETQEYINGFLHPTHWKIVKA